MYGQNVVNIYEKLEFETLEPMVNMFSHGIWITSKSAMYCVISYPILNVLCVKLHVLVVSWSVLPYPPCIWESFIGVWK